MRRAVLFCLEALKPQAAEVVDEDERQHDGEKRTAPAVEHEAVQEQNGIFELGREIVQRQCDGQRAAER